MNKRNGHVIIGNSAAALSAIKSIRKLDSSCPITLVSAEKCYAYSPVLTTYHIANRITEENMFLTNNTFYREYNVNFISGSRVEGVNSSQQVVHLQDGSVLPYDNLLVATGATPKQMSGVELAAVDQVLTLRTIADARQIKKQSASAKDILIIGAGLVSLQSANSILRINPDARITFIVSSKRILSQNLDLETSLFVQKQIQAIPGITFKFGKNIQSICKTGDRLAILLDSGDELFTDLVIVGKGVNPNVGLVAESGVNLNKGILVDECLRTNIANIYAAGDVAEGYHLQTGKQQNVPNWVNACEQGRVAGINMAGCREAFRGVINENITTLFGLTIASIGLQGTATGAFTEAKHINEERGMVRKFWMNGDKLMGAVIIGAIHDAGVIKNLISNSINSSLFSRNYPNYSLYMGKLLMP